MLVTRHPHMAEQARMIRAHGSKIKYFNELIGLNSRLDEVQASILRVKLPLLGEWNERRREAAAWYGELLADIPGIQCPVVRKESHHVYHQYTIKVSDGRRDELQDALEVAGIGTAVYYPLAVHRLPVYEELGLQRLVAEQLSSEVLSLPMGPYLQREEQEWVAIQIRRVMGE